MNSKNETTKLPFRGDSMWPHLQSGDELTVDLFGEPRKLDEFTEGKILIHRDRDEWVAHRLVRFKGRLVLKGDFSHSYTWEEEPIVWGEVRGVRRGDRIASWPERPRFARWIAALSVGSLSSRRWVRRASKSAIFALYLFCRYF